MSRYTLRYLPLLLALAITACGPQSSDDPPIDDPGTEEVPLDPGPPGAPPAPPEPVQYQVVATESAVQADLEALRGVWDVDRPDTFEFELSDAPSQPPADTTDRGMLAPTEPLEEDTLETLISRLPDIQTEDDDVKEFAFRKRSLKAPISGADVQTPFPPDDALPPPAPEREERPLEVVRARPEGDVDIAPRVTLVFSSPMVPLSTLDQAHAKSVPAVIEPSVEGEWSWLDTRTLQFVPPSRMPKATHYKVVVPKGTTSETGDALPEDFELTFSTPPPRLTNWRPTGNGNVLEPTMIATFDQRIDPDAVFDALRVEAGGTAWPVRMASSDDVELQTPEQQIAFVPTKKFPKDTQITVTFEKGMPSAEGPRLTTTPLRWSFRTYGPFEVERAECTAWQCRPGPGTGFRLNFTNSIDDDSFDVDSSIDVSPELENQHIEEWGNSIVISGTTEPRTKYRVKVARSLRDVFGQKLTGKRSFEFRTKELGIYPSMQPTGASLSVLDPFGKPGYNLLTANVKELEVELWRVEPSQYDTYRDAFVRHWFSWNEDDRARARMPGEKLDTFTIKLEARKNETELTRIDLTPALPDGHGHVVANIVATRVRSTDDRDPGRMRHSAWLQSTDLGITTLGDQTGATVWVSRLVDGSPVANADVRAGKLSGTTNASGLVQFQMDDDHHSGLIASAGDDVAFLPKGSWEPSIHDPGRRARWYVVDDRKLYQPGESVHIKGWVRAVDLRKNGDVEPVGAGAEEVDYIVRDPRYNELHKGTAELDGHGGFDFAFDLPDNTNLGWASIELTLNEETEDLRYGRSHQHRFQIEEFRRPEFEVSVNTPPGPHVYEGDAVVDVTASYYAGGPLPNAQTSWRAIARRASYTPPNRGDFTFGRHWPWWMHRRHGRHQARSSVQHVGATDPRGIHRMKVDFGSSETPAPFMISLESSVTDVNRQMWTGSGQLMVHPSQRYIGIRSPRFFYEEGDEVLVDTIVTNVDGELQPDIDFVVDVVRMSWVFEEGRWQRKPFDPQSCRTTSADDVVQCKFSANEGGQYMVRATVRDSDGRLNESRMAIWVAGGEGGPPNKRATGDEVMLLPDKSEYRVGDTAEVLVVSPWYPAEGVLTVRRSGIVEERRFTMDGPSHTLRLDVEEGHVPGVGFGVEIIGQKARKDKRDSGASTDDDGRGDTTPLPPRPAWASGSTTLSIPPLTRDLTVQPVPRHPEAEPGSKTRVDVWVRDHAGDPVQNAQVALMVVDESILALAGYELPDPIDAFYHGRNTGLRKAELRRQLLLEDPEMLIEKQKEMEARLAEESERVQRRAMQKNGGHKRRRSSKKKSSPSSGAIDFAADAAPAAELTAAKGSGASAPDDDAAQPEIAVRSNFSPLAVFEPDARTAENGHVSVEITLPDNLTRYRVMAVATDGERRFGHGESSILARLELMMRPSAPRFLNYGDRADVPVVVQNLTDEDMRVAVAARVSNAELTGDAGVKVRVPARDRVEVRFPTRTHKPGTARMQFAAASGSRADAAEISLPVWTPATTEAFAVYGHIDKGAIAQPIERPKNVEKGFGGLEITTTSTALYTLTDAMVYLANYPFSCSEQLASRVLGVASLRDVLAAFDVEELPSESEIAAYFAEDLKLLQQRQNGDGGFPWWNRDSVPYVSIHVAHALVRARQQKIPVDDYMYDRVMRYLQNIDGNISAYESRHRFSFSEAARAAQVAYALYVRSLDGQDVTARGKQLFDKHGLAPKGNLSLEAQGWLLSALHRSGGGAKTAIDTILRNVHNRVVETPKHANFTTSYSDGAHVLLHSNRRTDGILLEALIQATPDDSLIPKVVLGLQAHRTKGRWRNTQENSFILVAMERYFSTYENVTPDFLARVWLGEDFAGEQEFKGYSAERQHLDIPMSFLLETMDDGKDEDLVIQKDGDGRLYYRVGMRYAPSDLKLEPLDRGFAVERVYEAVDDPDDVVQEADGTWRIASGATVRVKLTMVATNRRYHVALVDPLPAGLEPVNPALATTGQMALDDAMNNDDWSWSRYWFTHQNLRDERVEAFTTLLWEGNYTYTYVARATTPGEFVVPPTKAEEMYTPEVFGRSRTDRVVVE